MDSSCTKQMSEKEVREKEVFSISNFLKENPNLSNVLGDDDNGDNDSESELSGSVTSPTPVTVICKEFPPVIIGESSISGPLKIVPPVLSPLHVQQRRRPRLGGQSEVCISRYVGQEISPSKGDGKKYSAPSGEALLDSPLSVLRSPNTDSSSSRFSPESTKCQSPVLRTVPLSMETAFMQSEQSVSSSPKRRSRRRSICSSSTSPYFPGSLSSKNVSKGMTWRSFLCETSLQTKQISTQPSTALSPELHHSDVSSDDSLIRELLQPPSPGSPIKYVQPTTHSLPVSAEQLLMSSVKDQSYVTDLDKLSKFSRLKRTKPPRQKRPHRTKSRFSTAIDPYTVGLNAIQEALRENTRLDDELRKDRESMDWADYGKPCACDVRRHPSWWTQDIISDVHNHSFLLHIKDLAIRNERIVASNSSETIFVYSVPMEEGHPWKVKAEMVLRFIDVEVGIGDQTAFDILYYVQPSDRKVFLLLSPQRVLGIVVAEKLSWAHRILSETVSYRDLEEDPVQVRVGINRLWVHVSMRRRHLATMLCDVVGRFFYEDETLKKEDYAFNNISNSMIMFAKLYLKTLRVPLYDGKTGIKI